MNCRELTTLMDSYMGDELLVETNHEVIAHLESCAGCRSEIAARRELTAHLKKAVLSRDDSQINTVFAATLSRDLKESALKATRWQRIFSTFRQPAYVSTLAAFSFLFIGLSIWFVTTSYRGFTGGDALIASFREIAAIAAGDHENCAVKYNLKETPISLDEAAVKYGAFNRDLDKTVISAIGTDSASNALAGAEFIESHSCIYEGRRFAHVVVRKHGELVSMLVTDTDLPLSGDEIVAAIGTANVRSAGFVVAHHAVFIVSRLSETENTAMAQALVPTMSLHFEKLGA